MLDAKQQLDAQYNEMRWRILSLAADFDRLQRYAGDASILDTERGIGALSECVNELLSTSAGRAQRVQTILSDKTPDPRKGS